MSVHGAHAARGPRRVSGGVLHGALGVLGEILVTLGVLVGLFLAWQLWWTDVTAGAQHREVLHGLDRTWAQAGSPSSPPADAVAPPQSGPPPAVPVAPEDTAWATLHVPAFDEPVIPVGEGVDLAGVLDVIGAGHYPGTAMPGQVGNFSLAGHRTTYAKPFHDIDRLQAGDPVVLETADAYYVYEVTSHEIVPPDRVDVVAPVPDREGEEPTQRMLTMTACHPLYSARQRYVVHARFAYWTRKADGLPAPLAAEAH